MPTSKVVPAGTFGAPEPASSLAMLKPPKPGASSTSMVKDLV